MESISTVAIRGYQRIKKKNSDAFMKNNLLEKVDCHQVEKEVTFSF